MIKISEEYLHFAWKSGLFLKENPGGAIQIIEITNPGQHNLSSGPDFFNARVKIDDTVWAGNVEIHVKASDWYRHEHDKDPAYDSVILHVVLENDCDVYRINGEKIPVLKLIPLNENLKQYFNLILDRSEIHCRRDLPSFNRLLLKDWITKMMIARLQEKTNRVFKILENNQYDWEETLYKFIGQSFGFKTNNIPFTLLVEATPLKLLLKYRNNPETINALLFGQAGFLEDMISGDTYYDTLRKEYQSLKKMLPQKTLYAHTWKFMRSRPANFPTVRISQFASLVIKSFPLFAQITECSDVSMMKEFFRLNTAKYWEDHMLFGKTGRKKNYRMGKESAESIIINAVLPVFFSYGKFRMRNDMRDRALRFYEELPPEKNEIMNMWKKAGITPENAFESQGLLQLFNNYCKPRKCLECLIGYKLISRVVR